MITEQKKTRMAVGLLALTGLVVYSLTAAAGSLEPAAAPAPTMKTLDEVEARTAVQKLGGSVTAHHLIDQPGSYYLTANIVDEAGKNAVEIAADNVTLDLNGFALIGPGSLAVSGIVVTGARVNIAITNGSISNWGSIGINAASAAGSQIENIRVSGNMGGGLSIGDNSTVANCKANSNTGSGIVTGSGCRVSYCMAKSNTITGIVSGDRTTIENCTAESNGSTGISTGSYTTITNCTTASNGNSSYPVSYGIQAGTDCTIINCNSSNNGGAGSVGKGIKTGFRSSVINCTANSNTSDGIDAGKHSSIIECTAGSNSASGISAAYGSTISNCTTGGNGVDGIVVTSECRVVGNTCDYNASGAGIHTLYSSNRIENNHVTDNKSGIKTELNQGDNFIIKNSSHGSVSPYDLYSVNYIGPMISGAGVITSVNPWANFAD